MRMLPRKVTILTQTVPIVRTSGLKVEEKDCYGAFSGWGPLIELDADKADKPMGHEKIRSTLLHETLHAMLELGGLCSMFEDEAEESFISRFGPLLLAFVRDNPNVIFYLQEGAP